MSKVKRSWIAVVMVAIVLGTLVGVVWARPNDRPQNQDITRKVTVPAGWFAATQEGMGDYYNGGNYLHMTSSWGTFAAGFQFPCLPSVTVEKLILYAYDGSANDVCLTVWRTRPNDGTAAKMGEVCSYGSSATDPRTFTDSTINNAVAWPSHGVWLDLYIEGPGITVYGAVVEYHRNI